MNISGFEQLKGAHLHFMGIGGQGISAVAQIALQEGASISGCDQSASATTSMLMQKGVPVEIGHNSEHLAQADALIVRQTNTGICTCLHRFFTPLDAPCRGSSVRSARQM